MTRWNRGAGWRQEDREDMSLSHGEHLSKALAESRTLPDAGILLMGYYSMLLGIFYQCNPALHPHHPSTEGGIMDKENVVYLYTEIHIKGTSSD